MGPAVLLTGAMVVQAYRNERQVVGDVLLSTARAVASVIDATVDQSSLVLDTISKSDALVREDFAGLDAYVRRTLGEDDRWFVLSDASGQQWVNSRLEPGAPRPRIEWSPEVLRALEHGGRHVSPLKLNRATGIHVLRISQGYFQDGKLRFIMSMSFSPAGIRRALNLPRYAPGRIVTVLDQEGIIIARSVNHERFAGGPGAPKVVKHAREEMEATFDNITLDDVPVVTALARARCGWTASIGAPKVDLFASARRLLLLGGLGALSVMAMALVMAAWIARGLVHSVDVLQDDAQKLVQDGQTAGEATGLDELDSVAESMRTMGRTLLRRSHMLEVQNRVNASLVAERDLQKIILGVIAASCELTGAQFGAFFFRPAGAVPQKLRLFAAGGDAPAALGQVGEPAAAPFTAIFREAGTPVRIADLSIDTRYHALFRLFAVPTGGSALQSCLALPVTGSGREAIGWLLLGHARSHTFTAESETVMQGLAAEAAIAIENAKLYHALAHELEAKSRAETELREAQRRLQQHARELEQRVEERTASLREAVTQMEEFSYTVSHDLRGPLRAMHAFAEALVEDYGPKLDDTARDYLQRIQRASLRMEHLTTNLLRYSRVARADVQLGPTELEPLVRDTIEHYAELQPPGANVMIERPLLPVQAHPPSLTQCVANLLTNAVKFSRPGQRPNVRIRTERQAARVRIWFEDDGVGIPPEYHAGIFRVFERVPNSLGASDGTGVGLAIVRKAAEKMGGTCGVESDGQHGSRFWIDLSAADPAAAVSVSPMITTGAEARWHAEAPALRTPGVGETG